MLTRLFLPILASLLLIFTPGRGYSISASIPKSDSLLRAQIQAKIAGDPILSNLPLKLSVNNSVVTISGIIPKKKEAMALIVLVESTAGVESLDASGLSLEKGLTLPADDLILSLVVGLFNREGLMGPLSQEPTTTTLTGPGNATYVTYPPPINIHVKTEASIVYLSGTVPNQSTVDKAIALANSIPGVTEVRSTLAVASGQ